MKYYIVEHFSGGERTAWNKARLDAEKIAEKNGYKPIIVTGTALERVNTSLMNKIKAHISMGKIWEKTFSELKAGDTVFIQLPVVNNYLFLSNIFKKLRKRGVEIVVLVHDLEVLRLIKNPDFSFKRKIRMKTEELGALRECSRIIVHNEKMQKFILSLGINTPLTILGIFDYLISPPKTDESLEEFSRIRAKEKSDRVIVAGNLSEEKSGYIYKIPDKVKVELYGVNYKENQKENLHYNGSFPADLLPYKLCNGFGLVWDGSSAETCEGVYGEYLRYNNPHKTSLYLASEVPVIIWKEAALASFVEVNGLGVTISSIEEIPQKLALITDDEYKEMFKKVTEISKKLRNGEYLQKALS